MKKKHGWVVYWIGTGFVNWDGEDYTYSLRDALVFDTRARARKNSKDMGSSDETIRKVSLFKNGRAKKVIGKG